MTAIATLSELSSIPVRQLASGTIAVLDQLEARLPLEVPLCGSLLATLAPRVIATPVFQSFLATIGCCL